MAPLPRLPKNKKARITRAFYRLDFSFALGRRGDLTLSPSASADSGS
jgi:hypothetical protein